MDNSNNLNTYTLDKSLLAAMLFDHFSQGNQTNAFD